MKNKKVLWLVLIFMVSGIMGFSSLYTPRPKGENSKGFSAERAKKDIEAIASLPHSVKEQNELNF